MSLDLEKGVVVIYKNTPAPVIAMVFVAATSLIITIVIVTIFGCSQFSESHDFYDILNVKKECMMIGQSVYVVMAEVFVAICFLLIVIMYLVIRALSNRDNDALTNLREYLLGKWEVEADSSTGELWKGSAEFILNKIKKLNIYMDVPQRGDYAQMHLYIREISVRAIDSQQFRLTYFIDEDFVAKDGTIVPRLIAARLKWVIIPSQGRECLDGIWYDLQAPATSTRRSGRIIFSRIKN